MSEGIDGSGGQKRKLSEEKEKVEKGPQGKDSKRTESTEKIDSKLSESTEKLDQKRDVKDEKDLKTIQIDDKVDSSGNDVPQGGKIKVEDIMDAAFHKILSENQPLSEDVLEKDKSFDRSPVLAVGDSITITSPSISPDLTVGGNLVVVSTTPQSDRRHNTSTIIINDLPDPSNSLASNISQVSLYQRVYCLSLYLVQFIMCD